MPSADGVASAIDMCPSAMVGKRRAEHFELSRRDAKALTRFKGRVRVYTAQPKRKWTVNKARWFVFLAAWLNRLLISDLHVG